MFIHRPSHRLIFDLNGHEGSIRVDVLASGEIKYVSGSHDNGWISLEPIRFLLPSHGSPRPLTLTDGWLTYGGEYGSAMLPSTLEKDVISDCPGIVHFA